MIYDYAKLKGRIIEKMGSQTNFAKALGVSDRTLSLKMRNKVVWRQDEIAKSIDILSLPIDSVMEYFFTVKTQ